MISYKTGKAGMMFETYDQSNAIPTIVSTFNCLKIPFGDLSINFPFVLINILFSSAAFSGNFKRFLDR